MRSCSLSLSLFIVLLIGTVVTTTTTAASFIAEEATTTAATILDTDIAPDGYSYLEPQAQELEEEEDEDDVPLPKGKARQDRDIRQLLMATGSVWARNPAVRWMVERAVRPPPAIEPNRYSARRELFSPLLREKFQELSLDPAGQSFLKTSQELSWSFLRETFHSLVKMMLRRFMTNTSLNGFLNRGRMFVASTAQFSRLLFPNEPCPTLVTPMGPAVMPRDHRPIRSLLDIGAGDGYVTQQLEPLFSNITASETSPLMAWRLRQKEFEVLETANLNDGSLDGRSFDVISCLNVLDRCDKPLTLLETIRNHVKPDGRVVLAIVLPFSPYVEAGVNGSHKPSESIKPRGRHWEEWVSDLTESFILPAGFKLEAAARAPYLCEGDLKREFYWLDDLILVLSPV